MHACLRRADLYPSGVLALVLTALLTLPAPARAGDTFFGGYRTVDRLIADLTALEAAHPSLVELVDYGDSYAKTAAGGVSGPGGELFVGDDLLAVRVTNQAVAGPKPVFVFMACLHAAEISTSEVAMSWLDELVMGYGVDADATWLVDHHEIWVLPLTNPDGHRLVTLGTEHANGGIPWFWRKNAHDGDLCPWPTGNDFGDGATFGVDLNRNFDFAWGTSEGRGGSSAVCDSYYRGTAPASEPEVAALQSLIASLIADQRGPALSDAASDTTTGIFVQLHNPFQVIGSPWAHTPSPAPNQSGLAAIGGKLSSLSGYPYDQTHDSIYLMTGSAEEWVYGELGAPAFIVELGGDHMPPLARVDDTFLPEMQPLLSYAAKIARTPYALARGPEASAVTVVDLGGSFQVEAQIDDSGNGAQAVTEAEVYAGVPPWQAGAIATSLSPVDGAFDSAIEAVSGALDVSGLADGRHLVYVRGRDAGADWGPVSAAFVDVGPDSTPPVRSDATPAGVLVSTTTQTQVTLGTDEAATCRWDGSAGTDFATMSGSFDTTGGTAHATLLTGLVAGDSIEVFVRCEDLSGNANADDLAVAFAVAGPGELTAGLVGHWPLDQTSGTSAPDASGRGYDGDLIGAPPWVAGAIGGGAALSLDGVNDAVAFGRTPALDTLDEITIAAWIRHAPATGWHSIVDKRDAGSDGFDLYVNDSSRLFMRVDNQTVTGVATVADDAWHHVAGVYDGSTVELYVDGAFDRSVPVAVGAIETTNGLRLGENWELGNSFFSGDLDEVRIYDRALSAAEILDVYQYTGGPPPPDTTPPVRSAGAPTGTLPAGTTQATVSLTTDEAATCRYDTASGTDYGSMPGVFSTTGGTSHSTPLTGLVDDMSYVVHVRCEDAALNANPDDYAIAFSVAAGADVTAGLIGYWPMDEAGGTTVGDVSGNGYDGQIASGQGWTAGQVDGALALGGADPSVTVGAAPLIDDLSAVTMAVWMRGAPATDWHSLIDKRDAHTDGFDLFLEPGSRAFLRINNSTLTGTTVVADDAWHHLVGTFDGSRLTLYVDGVEDGSAVIGANTLSTSNTLRFGTGRQGGFFYTGRLDEVRIWNRGLTAAEVAEVYAYTGGPPPPDTTAPVRSDGAPSGTLPAGTTQTVISLTTDEDATCRHSDAVGTAYEAMTATFGATGGTAHATTVTPLADGQAYDFHVRCQDAAGNANDTDFTISFTVAATGSVTGLVAHWAFEDGSGTLVTDASGFGHHGQLNGGTWSTGRVGGGLSLAGGNHVAVPASAALDAPPAFTISAWIRHAPVTRFASIVDKRDATADGYDLYVSERSNLFMRVNDVTLEGSTPVADGAWHHVAGSWDGARLTLWVDGQVDATQSVLSTAIDVSGPLFVGRNFGGGFVFEGDVDEVRIYDEALGSEEILPLALPSGPTVTLPGWPDRFVVQRVGSAADLELSGATTGTAAVEARVLDDATGQPLAGYDWTVVDPAPVDGAWSGQLLGVPEGGWYRLEARQAGAPASAGTSQRFGVGVVVAAIGQSNMAKMFTEISFPGDGDLGTVTPATPNDLTRQYGYGNPRISASNAGGYSRLDGGAYGWSDVTGVGGVRLANNLAVELGIPVLLLDFAIDGTSIGQWTDTSWPNWQRFALAVGDVGGDLEVVLWHQGRADVVLGTLESTYRVALDTLKAQIAAELPASRTLEMVSAVQNRGDYGGNVDSRYNGIRKAQLEWIAATPEGYAAGNSIDTDLALDSFGRGDGHCTASQYEIMADRYSRGILQAIGAPGFEAGVYGGQIAAATLAGNVVTVTVAHDQGNALQVLDPASDVEGFELSDDGWTTVLRLGNGVASATLGAGGQTVELTLDVAPSGQLQLRYLYGQNAFGHKATPQERRANGNTLYDDFVYHPARPGLPVNGTVAPIVVQP